MKVGVVSVDGSKFGANASKHRSVTYERAGELIDQLRLEIADLMDRAEASDSGADEDPQALPREIARREALRERLDAARRRLEAQAKARAEAERADYEAKVTARAGRKGRARGKHPKPPDGTPRGGEQSNLSDPDSRLMRKSKRHEFRQAYNAQAVVDAGGSQLIVGARITNCASDRNELVADIEAIAADLGRPGTVLADNGYANGAEVAALAESGIEVLVATVAEGRRRRHDFRPTKAGTPVKEAKAEWLRDMTNKARQRRRPGAVQAAPAKRRAGVRHHQGGTRLHRLLAARPRQGGRRVGPGGAGLQLQAPAQAHAGDGNMTAFLTRLLDANGPIQSRQGRKSNAPATAPNPSSPSHPTSIVPPADDSHIIQNRNPTPKSDRLLACGRSNTPSCGGAVAVPAPPQSRR